MHSKGKHTSFKLFYLRRCKIIMVTCKRDSRTQAELEPYYKLGQITGLAGAFVELELEVLGSFKLGSFTVLTTDHPVQSKDLHLNLINSFTVSPNDTLKQPSSHGSIIL